MDRAEGETREERVSHDITRQELEAMKRQLQAAVTEMGNLKDATQVRVLESFCKHTNICATCYVSTFKV